LVQAVVLVIYSFVVAALLEGQVPQAVVGIFVDFAAGVAGFSFYFAFSFSLHACVCHTN
jgi:hypothetical protein